MPTNLCEDVSEYSYLLIIQHPQPILVDKEISKGLLAFPPRSLHQQSKTTTYSCQAIRAHEGLFWFLESVSSITRSHLRLESKSNISYNK